MSKVSHEDAKKVIDIYFNFVDDEHEKKFVDYINQQEKSENIIKQIKSDIYDMLVEFDEYGMEPTTPTSQDGQEIVDNWRNHFLNMFEVYENQSR